MKEKDHRAGYVKIRDFPQVYRTPEGWYMVSARRKKVGLDVRKTYPTQQEALDFRKQILENLGKYGAQPEIPTETKLQAELYGKLVERLSPFGKRPEDAVEHYIKFLGDEVIRLAKPTIGQLVDEYERHKLLERRDEQYENEIKLHCRFIKRTWGDLRIDALRKHEIDTTLTKLKPHKGTRKKYLTHVRMFFHWVLSEDKGYIASNPALGIKYKADSFAKEHYDAEQTKSLLRIVKEIAPELLGYYSILAFVGLRPTEGARVIWRDINFETQQLRVNSESKTGERYCKLEPVAMEWIKWHKANSPEDAPFVPEKNMFNLEREVREGFRKLNDGKWIADGLRHTFATHYVSLIEDEPRVAFYLGNSVATIRKHYARRLPKSEIEAFWGLTPAVVLAEKPATK